MNTDLAQFQDVFAQALFASQGEVRADVAGLAQQPGFAVYRNTVMKGCTDALQANFPSVTRLVGEEWMRAAAAVYVRMHLPEDVRMLYYGTSFPEFLAQFEPAAELPYLAAVAWLDRFWTDAHAAAEETPLDPGALSGLVPEVLAKMVLRPHPSARWMWFPTDPIYTIWQRNREACDDDSDIAWRGEGVLLVRPHAVVEGTMLDASGCAFLDACKNGQSLAEAANAALAIQADTDLAQLLAKLLNVGAFKSLSLINCGR